jgi:hypothetical protein
MINNIIILDDVVSVPYQDAIEAAVMAPDLPWYYKPVLTKPVKNEIVQDNDSPGWFHGFFSTDDGGPTSPLSSILLPLMYEGLGKAGHYPKNYFNGRLFMMQPRFKNSPDIDNWIWHIDKKIKHLVCLYYANNSSGPTIISDAIYGKNKFDQFLENVDLPVLQKIEPKKGRMVIFDGYRYHAASNPETGRRIVINFNVAI